jgi:hypothetical protein
LTGNLTAGTPFSKPLLDPDAVLAYGVGALGRGELSASGRHPPRTVDIPPAVARAIPSPTNRDLPIPASPTTGTSRARPANANRSRDNSGSRPTKAPHLAIRPHRQPTPQP